MSDSKPSVEIQKNSENPKGARSSQAGSTGSWEPRGMCFTPHVKIDPNSQMGGRVFEKK